MMPPSDDHSITYILSRSLAMLIVVWMAVVSSISLYAVSRIDVTKANYELEIRLLSGVLNVGFPLGILSLGCLLCHNLVLKIRDVQFTLLSFVSLLGLGFIILTLWRVMGHVHIGLNLWEQYIWWS